MACLSSCFWAVEPEVVEVVETVATQAATGVLTGVAQGQSLSQATASASAQLLPEAASAAVARLRLNATPSVPIAVPAIKPTTSL
jgi:hypothetical protein